MLVVLVAFITFLGTSIWMYNNFKNGNFLTSKIALLSNKEAISKLEAKLNNYKTALEKYYLGEVDEEKLIEGAVKGYIEALDDPYTEYISKEDMKEYLENTKGNFVGVGIYMVKNTKEDKIQVLSPIKNSPAEKAGIRPGDLIKSVDGVEYKAEDLSVVATKIKGQEGTTVKLEILRDKETLSFELKRENIKINPLEGKILEKNIGYISFSSFDENTASDFKEKYEEFSKQGISSLIIDLRNNGGGIVDEALKIADYVADKGSVLLYEVDKNNKEEVKKSENDPIINIPIIILTNENTASSSEILAGALKDLGKAKTVGEKTYGKGVIQQVMTLDGGSGLKVTAEKYLTPNKKEINKIGIEPDEEVKLPDTVKNIFNVEEKDDTQLQKAIEMLKK